MIYDGLNYSHVVYTCKFCDKKWDFASHFFMGDILAYLARFLLVAHCVIYHTKEVKLKDILNGLKCGLLVPVLALKTILIAALQIALYPLYLLLTFLFFKS
jgi:hypothetical protein